MLDAKVINSFLQGINSTCGTIFGKSIKTGKIYVKSAQYGTSDVVIFVGVTGAYRGQSVISMSVDTAKELSKRMMVNYGMAPSDELDELAKSALSELSNMIMGSASQYMAKNEYLVDITPPTLIVGMGLQLSNAQEAQNICVPLEIDGYSLEIAVFLKENKK